MEEPGPYQATIGPDQVDDNLHQAESRGSQHSNPYNDRESAHTNNIDGGQSRGKGHVSHAKIDRDMHREIDELKKELHRAWRRHSSPNSELSSDKTDDATYR